MAHLPQSGFAVIFSKISLHGIIFAQLNNCRGDGFFTVKVCVRGQCPERELATSQHLKNADSHPEKSLVRLVLDSFEITGPYGKHFCLVYQSLGMSFTEFRDLLPGNKFPKDLAQRSIQLFLISLAFMHDNWVVHTGKLILHLRTFKCTKSLRSRRCLI